MESAGKHEAILPNFLQSNCLQKNLSSEIEYDLGYAGGIIQIFNNFLDSLNYLLNLEREKKNPAI